MLEQMGMAAYAWLEKIYEMKFPRIFLQKYGSIIIIIFTVPELAQINRNDQSQKLTFYI